MVHLTMSLMQHCEVDMDSSWKNSTSMYGNAYSRSGGATDYNRGNYCDDYKLKRGSGCVTSSFYEAIGDMPAAAVANHVSSGLGLQVIIK